MKSALEVSMSGSDDRWPKIFSESGISDITIDLNTFVPFDMLCPPTHSAPHVEIKGAIPGYRWRQKVYRKTERFFHLCAQYGIRTAIKKAARHLLGPKGWSAQVQLNGSPLVAAVDAMVERYARNGIQPVLMRAPSLSPEQQDANLSGQLLHFARESIRLCARTGCPNLVVQPLFAGIAKGSEWEANRRFFLELLPLAKRHNVTILLENQTRNFHGRIVRGLLSDPSEAANWIDSLNSEAHGEIFGMCMNVDACIGCRQDVREYIQHLGRRIKAVQTRFNLDARFHYRELILALRKIHFSGVLACDARLFLRGVPDSLLPSALIVIAQTLAYLRMQIELEMKLREYPNLVLFGTGVMFQNYMRNYGQLYPPLFACDNSAEKWGNEVCGVRVFPPQKLCDLPEDCGVFICNRFYEETEKQLTKIGVHHIERFNDEVLIC